MTAPALALAKLRGATALTADRPWMQLHLGISIECIRPAPRFMWDVFFDREACADDESLVALIDAAEQNRVTEAMLARHAEPLTGKLGCRVGLPVDRIRQG